MGIYAKAITAVVLLLLGAVLKHFGLTPDSTVADVVTAVVTAAGVYFVPNKK